VLKIYVLFAINLQSQYLPFVVSGFAEVSVTATGDETAGDVKCADVTVVELTSARKLLFVAHH